MSDFGLFASRFHSNTNSLRHFDEALRYFKHAHVQKSSTETSSQVQKLLFVLKPIAEMLDGYLSKSVNLDEQNILKILQHRHTNDWQRYREQIMQLTHRLMTGDAKINASDFEILNDIADAIDTECANLFRRISGRL